MFKRAADGLSPQQLHFADEHGATPGGVARTRNGSVFMYRDEGWRTIRWLVDPSGRVEDFISLRQPVRAGSGRFVRRDAPGMTVGIGNGPGGF
jgi:hypothetical protein